MKKRRTWRWTTRTTHTQYVMIWQGLPKPVMSHITNTWTSILAPGRIAICADVFQEITGLIIPTDRPQKVYFTATIGKPKAKVNT